MIGDLLYSLNAVLPVLIIMSLGFILGKVGFLKETFIETADKLVFKVALPVLLFVEISGADIDSVTGAGYIIFALVSITLSFAVVFFISLLFIRDRVKRGAFIQGSCRSNIAILGIPLAESMFGESSLTTIAVVMSYATILFNVYSVFVLTFFGETKEKNISKMFRNLFFSIIKNPLNISIAVAMIFLLFRIPVPVFADRSLGYLSNLTVPVALLSLGANFKVDRIKSGAAVSVIAAALKIVVMPAVFVTAAAIVGFRGEELGALFILFSAPTAVSSYIMAKNMDSDSDLAAQILVLTTGFCILTIFTGTFILKSLSLI